MPTFAVTPITALVESDMFLTHEAKAAIGSATDIAAIAAPSASTAPLFWLSPENIVLNSCITGVTAGRTLVQMAIAKFLRLATMLAHCWLNEFETVFHCSSKWE